ncbi:MAG: cupin-like domain-containing protein [Burkholderiales bacterium]|nr:cupin-like domain-containing protein [Burkholderiales bacterium]
MTGAIRECHDIDGGRFAAEVRASAEPLVIRGFAAHWPLVRLACHDGDALVERLRRADNGVAVDAVMVPPLHRGRVTHHEDGVGFTFLRNEITISALLEMLARYARFESAPAVAIQSAPLARCAPSLCAEIEPRFIDAQALPRLWLGNALVTPAHFDESSNIACVVAGEREFTLFAPEEVGNLYPGPPGRGPAGAPVSLVDFDAIDAARFPRAAGALARARRAVLRPGDAIYIPPLWWHRVVSRHRELNLMINFWWLPANALPGLEAMQHAALAFGAMPPAQRAAWQAMFAYWVFAASDDSRAHLPPPLREWLAPEEAAALRARWSGEASV